jgi:hypothetical protein
MKRVKIYKHPLYVLTKKRLIYDAVIEKRIILNTLKATKLILTQKLKSDEKVDFLSVINDLIESNSHGSV